MADASTSTGSRVRAPSPDNELRDSLARLLRQPLFTTATRRGRLLRYLIEQSLAGKGREITEYAIGLDVFEKPTSFDTRIDSSVRAEMSRLRRLLSAYYEQAGRTDPWRVEFRQRGYLATFVRVPPAAEASIRPALRLWKWWGVGTTLAVTLAGGVVLWRLLASPLPVRSVVVLPFENLTGQSGEDYLADGVTEELTDSLAHIPDLRVVARTSAFQFKGKGIDIRQVGRQLRVEAVVEGSVRKIDGGLRLTAQVNRTHDGYHILSKSIDGGAEELGRLERDLAGTVQASLRPSERFPVRHVPSGEATRYFLKANAVGGQGTTEAFQNAVTYLNRAIESDPSFADAYASLAGV